MSVPSTKRTILNPNLGRELNNQVCFPQKPGTKKHSKDYVLDVLGINSEKELQELLSNKNDMLESFVRKNLIIVPSDKKASLYLFLLLNRCNWEKLESSRKLIETVIPLSDDEKQKKDVLRQIQDNIDEVFKHKRQLSSELFPAINEATENIVNLILENEALFNSSSEKRFKVV